MTSTSLQVDINSLPMHLQQELADFVAFLKSKKQKEPDLSAREFGFAKGKIKLAADFDAPLDDFKAYM